MFGKLSIAKRLALGFGVVVLLMILVAVVGVSRLAQLDQGTPS